MLLNLAVLVLCAGLLWLRGLTGRRMHALPELWGPAFVLLAFTSLIRSEFGGIRPLVAFFLVLIWAGRLWWHTARRARGQPEDRHLRRLRARWASGFPRKSLVRLLGLQLAAVWVCSLAVQHAIVDAAPLPLGLIDGLALVLWGLGLAVSVVADHQLAQARAASDGGVRVFAEGLWRYSRHPNYFGEILVSLGFYFLAAGGGSGLESIAAPAMFVVLVSRISGIPRVEAGITARRPGYDRYQSTTSALVPLQPLAPMPEVEEDEGLVEWSGPPSAWDTWDSRGA